MIRKLLFKGNSILVVAGFVFLPVLVSGTDIDQKVKKAKVELQAGINTWNMEKMKQAKDMFLNLLMKEKSENTNLLYFIALCDYRLATFYMTTNSTVEAERHTKNALKYLEKIMETNPSWGEPFALYASMMGFEIALDMSKGMTLGMKIYEYFGMAFEKEPENPRVNLLKGSSDLHTPEEFGGGPDRAIETLTKAVALFEKEKIKDPMKPSWGKEEAYTFLGMAYKQKGDVDKAREFFKKALEVNPEFGLARDELRQLDKKLTDLLS